MILMGFYVYILQCMYLLYCALHLLCFVRKWRNNDDQSIIIRLDTNIEVIVVSLTAWARASIH